jgi:hypothetical protein
MDPERSPRITTAVFSFGRGRREEKYRRSGVEQAIRWTPSRSIR